MVLQTRCSHCRPLPRLRLRHRQRPSRSWRCRALQESNRNRCEQIAIRMRNEARKGSIPPFTSVDERRRDDLIISAEAVHWFDLPKFYAVATRLLRKPGGIIAVWGYYYISLNEAFDAAMNRLTEATLPYWDEKVKEYVLKGYRTMPFPFESVGIGSEGKPEEMEMEQKFSFEGMLKYLKSMGPVITAKENGVDVMCEEMVKELRDAWGGGGDLVRTVVYKCFMIAGKVKA
ncbi:hypothetical protein Csa_008630 [Cucumis sativus]|nr:hypothetical protein Csa_008630 [Cucumis sativus]